MEVAYIHIPFREPNGSVRFYLIPTIPIPDDFYDKAQAEWLREHDPAGYAEFLHEVEEAFIAIYFGG